MSVMAIVKEVSEVVHRIRVKLYPSHLPGTEGMLSMVRSAITRSLRIHEI
ncbi:MAG: hypothetical protein LBG93_09310 [Treponema sp.]|nr:hypothetical protein [Treponema sp.]